MSKRRRETQLNNRSRYEHLYFAVAAFLLLVIIIVGFSKSYFLAGLFRAPLPSPLVHVHAGLFIAWVLLFNLQIMLVTTRNVLWHRHLGALMVGCAICMLIIGLTTVVMAIRRPDSPIGNIEFFGDLGQLVVFAILIGRAVQARRESATHKRLMLLGTAALMLPALARIALPLPAFLGLYLFVPLSLVVWDLLSIRRIHRATCAGLVLIGLLVAAALIVAPTSGWTQFVLWVKSS